MKKIFSIILCLILVVNIGVFAIPGNRKTVQAATQSVSNGYDAGYAGGMAGDGIIYAKGLDVSSWQGTGVDFKAIKNAGYDFVILRAGTSKGRDSCFDTLYTNAKAAGLGVGAYYYSYALNVTEANQDADNMLSWIAGKVFEYPLYFDYEDSSQESLSNETAKNICLTFMDKLANAGYLTGIYTGKYKSTVLPMSEICERYEIWIAHYYDYTYESKSPEYCTKYGMYQYTDRNYINGAGPYDSNVVFKDYPSIVKTYGFNGYEATITAPVDLGDDFYAKITNVNSGRNLSIYAKKDVILYYESTSDAQQWHFVRQSDGSYEITNVGFDKCLTAGGGVVGSNVGIVEDTDEKSQRWFIYEAEGGYTFRPANARTYVMAVEDDSTANEASICISTVGSTSQIFSLRNLSPTISASLDSSEVETQTEVTYTVTNADSATYSINGGEAIAFSGSVTVTVGKNATDVVTINVNNSLKNVTQTYTYTLKKGLSGLNYAKDGKWYYYTDGEIDRTFTGAAANSYGVWYVKKGVLDRTYTGMTTYNGQWIYVKNGKYDTTYTGMAKNSYGWWYIKKGNLDRTYTGTVANEYGIWYMKNGALDRNYTGMALYNNQWIYMSEGKYDITYTGMAKNSYGVWYMKDGMLDRTYTGMSLYGGKWVYVNKGKYDTSYTGIAKNSYGKWYMKNGVLDRTFSGKVTANGITYTVQNGKVIN